MKHTISLSKGIKPELMMQALERSLRNSEYISGALTVVKNIKHGRGKAQVQVRVTKIDEDFFDIKKAGINCP